MLKLDGPTAESVNTGEGATVVMIVVAEVSVSTVLGKTPARNVEENPSASMDDSDRSARSVEVCSLAPTLILPYPHQSHKCRSMLGGWHSHYGYSPTTTTLETVFTQLVTLPTQLV